MPNKKKLDYVKISARIRQDQKDKIEKEKLKDFSATQDSIIRDGIDKYFNRKEEK